MNNIIESLSEHLPLCTLPSTFQVLRVYLVSSIGSAVHFPGPKQQEDKENERSHRGWPPSLVITHPPNGWKEFPPSECSPLLTFLRVTAISAMELPGGEGMRKMKKEGRKKKQNWGISTFSGMLEVLAFVP